MPGLLRRPRMSGFRRRSHFRPVTLLVAANLLATGLVLPYARALDLRSVQPPDPVLVGAGDIAKCGGTGIQWATAKQLAGIGGDVFTLGDSAYDQGSALQYANCYGPTWGR